MPYRPRYRRTIASYAPLASWLMVLLVVLTTAMVADYALFTLRQRHGEVLSYTRVKQYIGVSDGNGHYHMEYLGDMDVPCIDAFLPHQNLKPCWYVSFFRDHWQ